MGLVQVRAGTGGDEAALFAADLLRMYERAAALHGWKFEVRAVVVLYQGMLLLSCTACIEYISKQLVPRAQSSAACIVIRSASRCCACKVIVHEVAKGSCSSVSQVFLTGCPAV